MLKDPEVFRGIETASASLSPNEEALLRKFDFVFLIDNSWSMTLPTQTDRSTRWRDMESALSAVAHEAVIRDDDGVDFGMLNGPCEFMKNITDMSLLRAKVAENGPRRDYLTPLASRLGNLLMARLQLVESAASAANGVSPRWPKSVNIIIMGDGEPQNQQDSQARKISHRQANVRFQISTHSEAKAVEALIVKVARKLDELRAPLQQIVITFYVFGNSREGIKYARRLDNRLEEIYNIKRDIVDHRVFTPGNRCTQDLLEVLAGAAVPRIDRNNDLHMSFKAGRA